MKHRAPYHLHRDWLQATSLLRQGGFPAELRRSSVALAWGFVLSLFALYHARAIDLWTGLPFMSLLGYGGIAVIAVLAILSSPVRVVFRVEDQLLISFAILILFRSAWATEPIAALTEAGIVVTAGLLQYFLARIVLLSLDRTELIVRSSMALISGMTVVLDLTLTGSDMERLAFGEGNPVGVSMVMVSSGAAALAVALWLVVSKHWRSRVGRFLLLAISLLTFFLCAQLALATGTRSTLAAFVAVALGLLVLRLATGNKLFIVVGLFLVAGIVLFGLSLGAAASIWLADILGSSLGARWESALLRLAQIFDPDSVPGFVRDMSVDERVSLQAIHWDAFREHFWFGAGPSLMDAGGPVLYPHNVLIELLSYYGVVGLMLFATFLLIAMVRVLELAKWNALGLSGYIAVALCLGALAQLQFSFTLWMAKPLFFGLAVIVTLRQQANFGDALQSETDRGRGLSGGGSVVPRLPVWAVRQPLFGPNASE